MSIDKIWHFYSSSSLYQYFKNCCHASSRVVCAWIWIWIHDYINILKIESTLNYRYFWAIVQKLAIGWPKWSNCRQCRVTVQTIELVGWIASLESIFKHDFLVWLDETWSPYGQTISKGYISNDIIWKTFILNDNKDLNINVREFCSKNVWATWINIFKCKTTFLEGFMQKR